jgi:hypothetical protein
MWAVPGTGIDTQGPGSIPRVIPMGIPLAKTYLTNGTGKNAFLLNQKI